MLEKEKIINSLANIHFKEALESANNGQLMLLTDSNKKIFKAVNLEDIRLTSGETLSHYLAIKEEEIKRLKEAINALVNVVNSNQQAVNEAINDLRETVEKGKIF